MRRIRKRMRIIGGNSVKKTGTEDFFTRIHGNIVQLRKTTDKK